MAQTAEMASSSPAFGDLLRHYRVAAGLTQEALADRAHLSARAISDLERGIKHTPRRDTLALLVEALQLSAQARGAFEQAARREAAGAARPHARAHPHPDATPAAPLVGRGAEVAHLERHLAGEGPPVLLLAGEPGIGKSRLLQAAAARAPGHGLRVLDGGCQRRGGQEPYAPVLEALERHLHGVTPTQRRADLDGCAWLARLLPELAEAGTAPLPLWTLPAEQERRLMFKAVARLLANVAGPGGTLLVLDDLQWAGADALDLLATLVRAAPASRLRVLGAYRATEVHPEDPLAQLLADLAHAGLAAHLALAPLAVEDAALLLDQLLAGTAAADEDVLRAEALRRTGGVPFFLVSCAQAMRLRGREGRTDDPIPWDVAQGVRQRVTALPQAARELMDAAAVIGRVVPRPLVADVLARPEPEVLSALAAACRARLLEEVGADAYQFAHDIIHEVVRAELGAAQRAVLHRRVAEALGRLPGEPPVDLLAYHYARADEQEKALHYLERAGDQARAHAAHAAAEQRYRELVERLDRLGRVLDGARVREKLAGVLATTARHEAALAVLEQAAATLQAAGDLEGLGRIAASMGHIHYDRGTLEDGVACLLPVAERLEARGPSVALAMVNCALAELNLFWGHWAQEVAAAERAGQVARLVGDERTLARAEVLRGGALCLMSRGDDGLPVLLEAARLAERLGDLECLSEALGDVAGYYASRGELTQSGLYLERALLVAEQLGSPVLMAELIIMRGERAFAGGEWGRAHGYYERVSTIHRQIALSPTSCDSGWLLVALGRLRLREGAWEEACRDLEEGRIIFAPQGKRSGLRQAQSLLAEIDILAGQPAAACARLVPLLDREGLEEHDVTTWVLPALAWAYLESGETDQAARAIAVAVRRARAGSYRLCLVDALRLQAQVALRQDQWAAAEGCLEEGLALARALPYPYGEGRLLAVDGRLCLDRGEPMVARERLETALAIFRRLGARRDVERTEQDLSGLPA